MRGQVIGSGHHKGSGAGRVGGQVIMRGQVIGSGHHKGSGAGRVGVRSS